MSVGIDDRPSRHASCKRRPAAELNCRAFDSGIVILKSCQQQEHDLSRQPLAVAWRRCWYCGRSNTTCNVEATHERLTRRSSAALTFHLGRYCSKVGKESLPCRLKCRSRDSKKCSTARDSDSNCELQETGFAQRWETCTLRRCSLRTSR